VTSCRPWPTTSTSDTRHHRTLADATRDATALGAADILLTDLLALLSTDEAAVVRQMAVSRASMSLDDLAFAVSGDPRVRADAGLARAVERLRELTLLTPGVEVGMHPWTAELITRYGGQADATAAVGEVESSQEWALAMRRRRFEQGRGAYEDLIEIPRHLAQLGRYDHVADLAGQVVDQALSGTLARVAYLADIRPLIPDTERAWVLVADLEVQAFLAVGDLTSARRQLRDLHHKVEARASADPTNTEWQRDLSISHNKLGDVAVAAGDLTSAQRHYEIDLCIAEQLARLDPSNAGWKRDVEISRQRITDLRQRQEQGPGTAGGAKRFRWPWRRRPRA
jgi:hypothetical protein